VSGYREKVSDDIIQVKTFSPEVIISTMAAGEIDLMITALTPPDGWFATPVSHQPIVVVANLENEIRTITLTDLQKVFSGQSSSWEELTGESIPVQPIIPLQGDSTRNIFENSVMKGVPFSSNAFLAPTLTYLLDLIQDHVGSIGFLLQRDVSDRVKQIDIDEVSSGSATDLPDDYPLWIDILAVSKEEPQGHLRKFLVWLQTEHME
jgi:phosphate transport system substrate-binding protein